MLRPVDLLPFRGVTLRFSAEISLDAGSLLPGPLAVTRTGLTPVGQMMLLLGTPNVVEFPRVPYRVIPS
jgi:hypothetical protein